MAGTSEWEGEVKRAGKQNIYISREILRSIANSRVLYCLLIGFEIVVRLITRTLQFHDYIQKQRTDKYI